MRISFFAALPLVGAVALALAPAQSSAQVSITLRLGNPISVTHYNADVYGDWHTEYRNWNPSTLYYYDGRWYSRSVAGSRAVVVYRSREGEYFLPPQDNDWNNKDKRYNYKRRPVDEDYRHAVQPSNNGRGRGRGRGNDKDGKKKPDGR